MKKFGAIVQLCLASLTVTAGLKLGSFNIRTFGRTKMSKPEVVDILLQTVERYDLFLVMEIRDSTQTAIYSFLDQLNDRTENPYSVILSERLGRTSYKEQYAFFYKESAGLSVSDAYVFDDGDESAGNDTFAREPYVVRFNSSQTVVQDFVLIAIHTAPDDAVLEVDGLADVYEDAVARWGVDDVMVLGDLNSDCSYVTSGEWDQIRLWTDTRFTWLVDNDADTTVSSTDCAYDRFVAAGEDLLNGINTSSVSVFNYKDAFNITQDLAEDVSDHWPIELDLYDLEVETKGPLTTPRTTTTVSMSTVPPPTTERSTAAQGQSDVLTTPLSSTKGTVDTQDETAFPTVSVSSPGRTITEDQTSPSTTPPSSTKGTVGVQDSVSAGLSTELWSGLLAVSVVVSFLMGILLPKAVTSYKRATGRVSSHVV